MFLTNWKVMPFLASAGMSGTSFLLRSGRMTVLMPACLAARIFFLQAADGQDQAAEGDLAGHGDVGADGFLQEQADAESGEHGDARAGAVLRDRAGGDVDVDVGLRELLFVDAEGLGVGLDDGEGGLALSFMTSPIWPVSRMPPLPGMAADSMKSISPPTGV